MTKTCRIGARKYSIVITGDDETLIANPDAHGYIDYPAGKIVLRAAEDMSFVRENLMHEVLHALIDDSGLNTAGVDVSHERFVAVLTPRLVQFMQENQALLADLFPVTL